MDTEISSLIRSVNQIDPVACFGRVREIQGEVICMDAPPQLQRIGAMVRIHTQLQHEVLGEVIGFDTRFTRAMAFDSLDGIRQGDRAILDNGSNGLRPDREWLGRVVNCHGQPMDGGAALPTGPIEYSYRRPPPSAGEREAIGPPVSLGVRALDAFTTCCAGQRLGIFAGSGVGKTMLLTMLAQATDCDLVVIGFIGERGREVKEILHKMRSGPAASHAVAVVATSDQSALERRRAAQATLAIAEYFSDEGARVLCLLDSVTRFAQAQREIGLSAGEPPTAKGYPPSVFSELPRLLERAGPGTPGQGSITGLFTVLTEGDDLMDPIADAVRAILDGHIVLDRAIAERGRFPAVNILKSISRTLPECMPPDVNQLTQRTRALLARYTDMEELVRLGAYKSGGDPELDLALQLMPQFEAFLSQAPGEYSDIPSAIRELGSILQNHVAMADTVETDT